MNFFDSLTILRLQRFYCISPFRVENNQIRSSLWISARTYFEIVFFMAWMIYTNKLRDEGPTFLSMGQNTSLIAIISGMEIVFTRLTFLVILVVSDINKKKQMNFLNKISKIDEQLIKQLNINLEYEKFRRGNISSVTIMCTIFLVVIVACSSLLLDVSKLLRPSGFGFLVNYAVDITTAGFCSFAFYNYTDILRIRFAKLNEKIALTFTARSEFEDNVKLRRLLIIKKTNEIMFLTRFYKDLCSCVIDLNNAFGLILVVTITHDFTVITSQLYLMFYMFEAADDEHKNQYLLGITIWIFPSLLNQIFKCVTCYITCIEARKCEKLLKSQDQNTDNIEVWELVDNFSLRSVHQKVQFTAANFFPIDMTLLYSIIGATTTYLLILIQFKMYEDNYRNDVAQI